MSLFSFEYPPAPVTLEESEETSARAFIVGQSKAGVRPVRLREAASTIFSLTAILPLLIFMYFMWRFGLLASTEVQLGIFLALAIALLGYALFRRLTQRGADLRRPLRQALIAPPTAKRGAGAGSPPAAPGAAWRPGLCP